MSSAPETNSADSGLSEDLTCAAARICDLFHEKIYDYCACRLFKKEFAEDATSAVFLSLVKQFDQLNGSDANGTGRWLYGQAGKIANNYVGKPRRRKEILAEVARQTGPRAQDDDAVGEHRLDWPTLYRAMFGLKCTYQEILVLRYCCGFQTSVIAEILNMRHGTVRVGLSRAISKLRRELGRPRGG